MCSMCGTLLEKHPKIKPKKAKTEDRQMATTTNNIINVEPSILNLCKIDSGLLLRKRTDCISL